MNSVAGLMSAPSFAILLGLTDSVVKPSTTRSIGVTFAARCRARLLISNWCFSSSDSAATERTPPGGTASRKSRGGDREDDEVAHVMNGTHRQSYAQDCPPRANCVTLLIRHPQAGNHLAVEVQSGRPPIQPELRSPSRRIAVENPLWGEERIANELLVKLGIRVSPGTVGKYMPKRPPPWRSALVHVSEEPCQGDSRL